MSKKIKEPKIPIVYNLTPRDVRDLFKQYIKPVIETTVHEIFFNMATTLNTIGQSTKDKLDQIEKYIIETSRMRNIGLEEVRHRLNEIENTIKK